LAHGIAKEVKWKSDGELEGPRLPSWIRKITRRNNERALNRIARPVAVAFLIGGRSCPERKVRKVFTSSLAIILFPPIDSMLLSWLYLPTFLGC
jgi:hypothetical protein